MGVCGRERFVATVQIEGRTMSKAIVSLSSPEDRGRKGRDPGAYLAAASWLALFICTVNPALADESGVSFWIPGLYGSLAALPGSPGWSFASLYYHTSDSAGSGVALPVDGQIVVGLDASGDVGMFGPAYTLASPILGGQAQFSLIGVAAGVDVSVQGTLSGPRGNTISGRREDSISGFGDLYPQATLKWNSGVSNYMVYLTGDIPAGRYDPHRLANVGIGHGAIDGGAGYTYLDQQTGLEFSGVFGLTGNFENTDTQYTSGIDSHLDMGISQFLSKQVHVGLVGYLYHQITGDSGPGARLGSFESRVAGVGPQVGYIFPVSDDLSGYLNVKGYGEFAGDNRPSGWNIWLTFDLSPAAH
jgi:hypothetical protein